MSSPLPHMLKKKHADLFMEDAIAVAEHALAATDARVKHWFQIQRSRSETSG